MSGHETAPPTASSQGRQSSLMPTPRPLSPTPDSLLFSGSDVDDLVGALKAISATAGPAEGVA